MHDAQRVAARAVHGMHGVCAERTECTLGALHGVWLWDADGRAVDAAARGVDRLHVRLDAHLQLLVVAEHVVLVDAEDVHAAEVDAGDGEARALGDQLEELDTLQGVMGRVRPRDGGKGGPKE